MALSDIVSISISANTVVPSRVGFGTPLILDYNSRFTDKLTRVYTSTIAMLADGFLVTDPAYKMAQAIFNQNPKVTQVRVGRTTHAPTQVIKLTPIAHDTHLYTVNINGTDKTFTSDGSATAAEIVTGLVAAIGVFSGVTATSTDAGATLTLTGTAGTLFEYYVNELDLTQSDNTADPTSATDLASIILESDDFYTIHPTCHGAGITVALAAAVESLKKILITEGANSTELAGTGIGSTLKTAAYVRTVFSYNERPWQFLGAAWAGKVLPQDPGSATWKFKTLAGITPSTLTATQIGLLEGKNVNYYSTIAGINIMQQGKSASGEFVDVTQGIDWLTQRLMERIFGDLANSLKIPFTDTGIGVIESDVRAQLREGINVGFLAASPEPVVTVPKASAVSTANKALRKLTGVEFSATLAGAIHSVTITGTVSV